VGYDDFDSITLKTRWALAKGLRGVFFWEVSQDRIDGNNVLQKASKAVWAPGE
jgi:chitinase